MDNTHWEDCLNEKQENVKLAVQFYRSYSCRRENFDEEIKAAKSYKQHTSERDCIKGICLVPECIYRLGCPRNKSCGYVDKFIAWCHNKGYNVFNIKERYQAYASFYESENKN